MSTKEKILLSLMLFFLSTLYLPWWPIASILAVAALTVYSMFFFQPLKEKWVLFKERKYLLWMFLFIIMVGISVLLSKNFDSGLRYLDPRLALIYFPVSVGTLYLRPAFKQKTLLGFAWLTTAICLLCLAWGIHRSHFFKQPEFLYNDSLTEILDQQSIYISLLVNISIYIFGYHLLFLKNRFKPALGLAILFLMFMSFLLASRTMMISLYGSIIAFAIYYVFKRKKYLEGITLLLGIAIGFFIVYKTFPKTFNRFHELSYTNYNYQNMGKESHYNMALDSTQWNGANFRIAAWKCGWELFRQHPITGVHIGDKHDILFDLYRQKNFQFAIKTNKNVHNNYLDILYSMGITGLVVFLAAWLVLPFTYMLRYKDGLSALILFTFAAAWITEIYFDRSLGGMLTGFFIPFLLTDKKEKRQP